MIGFKRDWVRGQTLTGIRLLLLFFLLILTVFGRDSTDIDYTIELRREWRCPNRAKIVRLCRVEPIESFTTKCLPMSWLCFVFLSFPFVISWLRETILFYVSEVKSDLTWEYAILIYWILFCNTFHHTIQYFVNSSQLGFPCYEKIHRSSLISLLIENSRKANSSSFPINK